MDEGCVGGAVVGRWWVGGDVFWGLLGVGGAVGAVRGGLGESEEGES